MGIPLGILTAKKTGGTPPIGPVHIRYQPSGITGSGSGWTDDGSPGGYDMTVRDGTPIEVPLLLDGFSGIVTTIADALDSIYAQADTEFTLLVVARRTADAGGAAELIGTLNNGSSSGWGVLGVGSTDVYWEIYTALGLFFTVDSLDSDWHIFCYQVRSDGTHYGGVNSFASKSGVGFTPPGVVVPSAIPLTLGLATPGGDNNWPGDYIQVDYWNVGTIDGDDELADIRATYPSIP